MTHPSSTTPPPAAAETSGLQSKPPRRILRTLIGTGAGNAVEWYDWAIYATFASYISTQLFSKAAPPARSSPPWQSSQSASLRAPSADSSSVG